jgi:serine phosphatase RsbU (regulator of sigma subunit)
MRRVLRTTDNELLELRGERDRLDDEFRVASQRQVSEYSTHNQRMNDMQQRVSQIEA